MMTHEIRSIMHDGTITTIIVCMPDEYKPRECHIPAVFGMDGKLVIELEPYTKQETWKNFVDQINGSELYSNVSSVVYKGLALRRGNVKYFEHYNGWSCMGPETI